MTHDQWIMEDRLHSGVISFQEIVQQGHNITKVNRSRLHRYMHLCRSFDFII